MKVYIILVDDTKEQHPEKVFSTRDKAVSYLDKKYQKADTEYNVMPQPPLAPDFYYSADKLFSIIIEMEVE